MIIITDSMGFFDAIPNFSSVMLPEKRIKFDKKKLFAKNTVFNFQKNHYEHFVLRWVKLFLGKNYHSQY